MRCTVHTSHYGGNLLTYLTAFADFVGCLLHEKSVSWTHPTHAARLVTPPHCIPEAMSDAPTLGKRRSSARIAAMETEAAAAAPSMMKRKSSTGLSGPMAALETGAPIG